MPTGGRSPLRSSPWAGTERGGDDASRGGRDTGPNGRSVTTLVNATPILSEEGELESVVVTVQDLTPLEDLERLRAEFLGMVSHELRTPLTSIKGSADTLLEESARLDPAEMRQFHRIIRDQTVRMRGLITDLLDVARIETGTLPVAPQSVEVTALVDQARNQFPSGGGGRDNLHIDLAPDLPRVMADRRRIVQVLDNLLSTAARYSPADSAIRLAAVREGVHVAFSVADNGRGVPAERLPQLFRKFSRLDGEELGRDLGGSGLGLSICKGIVEAHGGRIWAESGGEGLGTRFTFTIPAVEEPPAAPAPSSRRRAQETERGRILMVDDDPQTLRYVRDALTKAGYDPIVTGDPEEVPAPLMEANSPHLVLLDLVFPGADGIEMMRDILKQKDVPIIFLSVYGQDEIIARAFDLGDADYVVKPFSPTELAARIRAALRRAAPERPEPAAPHVVGDLSVDFAQRRATLARRPVPLTSLEYRLLLELALYAGEPVTHEHLLERIWGPANSDDPRPVRTVVKSLRSSASTPQASPIHRPTIIVSTFHNRCTVWLSQAANDGNPSRAPRALGQLVRHPLAEHLGRRHRGEFGVDEIALQRAVGRHRPGQRQAPLPLEPPQRMAHPYHQRAQLHRRQVRPLAECVPMDASCTRSPHLEHHPSGHDVQTRREVGSQLLRPVAGRQRCRSCRCPRLRNSVPSRCSLLRWGRARPIPNLAACVVPAADAAQHPEHLTHVALQFQVQLHHFSRSRWQPAGGSATTRWPLPRQWRLRTSPP